MSKILQLLTAALARSRQALAGSRQALQGLASSRRAFPALVALLILLPQAFASYKSNTWGKVGLARVWGGDEPHYLVYINSLVRDGDLWLGNNYQGVHQGDEEGGLLQKGSQLDDHSCWYIGDRKIRWFDYYDVHRWSRDKENHPVPRPKAGSNPEDAPVRESPRNTPGLAIFLAPLLFAAAGTTYLEPLALLCSALATIGAMLLLRMLARLWTDDPRVINLASAIAILGTPAWHYSRALFPEAYVLCFVLGAYAFGLTGRSLWVAGLFMGAALFIKPVMVIAGLPLGISLLLRRDWRGALAYAAPNAAFVVALLALNYHLYGAIDRMSNEFPIGDAAHAALLMIASTSRGLLAVAPIACLAVVGWGELLKARPEAWTLVAVCALQFGMSSLFKTWDGGYCYGPRYLAPICPVMCLGLLPMLRPGEANALLRRATLGVSLVSVAAGACAAIQYWRCFTRNPFEAWL